MMKINSWQKSNNQIVPDAPIGQTSYGAGQRTELGGWLPGLDVETSILAQQISPIVIQGIIDERQNGLAQPTIWSQINPESKKLVALSNSLSEAYTYGDARDLKAGLISDAMYALSPAGLEAEIKLAKEKYDETKNPLFYASYLSAGFSRSLQLGVVTGIISMAQIPYWAEGFARIITKDAEPTPLGLASSIYKGIVTIPSIIGTQMIPGIINETLENPGSGLGTLASIYVSHKVMGGGKSILAADDISFASTTNTGLSTTLRSYFNINKVQPHLLARAEAMGKKLADVVAERESLFAQLEKTKTLPDRVALYDKIAPDWFKIIEQNLYSQDRIVIMDRAKLDVSNAKFNRYTFKDPDMLIGEAYKNKIPKVELFGTGKTKSLYDSLKQIDDYINGKHLDTDIGDYVYKIDSYLTKKGKPEHIIITSDDAGNIVPRRMSEVLYLAESVDLTTDLKGSLPNGLPIEYSQSAINKRLGYKSQMLAYSPAELERLDIAFGGSGDGKALAKAANDKSILRNTGERGGIIKTGVDNLSRYIENKLASLERENNHAVRIRTLEQLPGTTTAEIALRDAAIKNEIALYEGAYSPSRLAKANTQLRQTYNFWFKTSNIDKWDYMRTNAVPDFISNANQLRKEPHLFNYLATEFFQNVWYDRLAAGRKYTNESRRIAGPGAVRWEASKLVYFKEIQPGLLDWVLQNIENPTNPSNISLKEALSVTYNYNFNRDTILTKDNKFAKVVNGYEIIDDPITGKQITIPTGGNPLELYNAGKIAKQIRLDWEAKYPTEINGIIQVTPKLPPAYWFWSGLDYYINAPKINPGLSWATGVSAYINLSTFGGLAILNKLGWAGSIALGLGGTSAIRQRWLDENKLPATYFDLFANFYTNTTVQRNAWTDWLNKLGVPTLSGTGLETATQGTPSQNNAAGTLHNWQNAWDTKFNPVYSVQTNQIIPDLYALNIITNTTVLDEKGYVMKFDPMITFIDRRWSVSKGITETSSASLNAALAADKQAKIDQKLNQLQTIQNTPNSERNIHYIFSESKGISQGTYHYGAGKLSLGTDMYGKVTRIVDGDTIEVAMDNGLTQKIRILGVDTPETHLAKNKPEKFGGQSKIYLYHQALNAKEYTYAALMGKRVRLKLDPNNAEVDGFGRTLAYVYYGSDFNRDITEDLIVNGFAKVSPYAVTKTPDYTTLQTYAQAHKLGVWSTFTLPVNDPPSTEQQEQIFITALDYSKTYFLQNLEVYLKNPGISG